MMITGEALEEATTLVSNLTQGGSDDRQPSCVEERVSRLEIVDGVQMLPGIRSVDQCFFTCITLTRHQVLAFPASLPA